MRTIHLRPLAIAAAVLVSLASVVAAQDKPTAVLNSLELKQLVARAEPADHVRLTAHFSALGDRYTAEAKRHVSMSQSFIGNPSRNLGTGMSVHCKRLADLNTRSATTVRELAAYHETMASGAPAALPKDGARFQARRRVEQHVRSAPDHRQLRARRPCGAAHAQRLAQGLARAHVHPQEQRAPCQLHHARLGRELEAAVHDHDVASLDPRAERQQLITAWIRSGTPTICSSVACSPANEA